MQDTQTRPVSRTGVAQFPTLRGRGRATADLAEYVRGWCATPPDASTHARDPPEASATPSTSSEVPRPTGAAFLNNALVSRDDQPASTAVPWGSHSRQAGGGGQTVATAPPPLPPPVAYPHVFNDALLASGAWDEAIHNATLWLAEGASHHSKRDNALVSTSSCQLAVDAVLSEDYSESAEAVAALMSAAPLDDFRGSLAVLVFHPHAVVSLWARQTLLDLVQRAAWATSDPTAPRADLEQKPVELSRELVRLLALWRLALSLLSTFKHLQAVRFCFTHTTAGHSHTSLNRDRVRTVMRGFAHLLVVLSSLDIKLTAATEAVRSGSADGMTSVPTTHPATVLLLGGSVLCYWLLAAHESLSQEATELWRAKAAARHDGLAHDEEGEGSDTMAESASSDTGVHVDEVARRSMRLLANALNERLGRDTTLVPPSLAVDTRKAMVKILVHALLDNARGLPASKEDCDWRLQRMRRLWRLALALEPPTGTVTVKKDGAVATADAPPPTQQLPVQNTAQWMLRALLRNAEIQLRFEDAVKEAKSSPRANAAVAATGSGALPDATFALYALLTTLENVAPPGFVGSAFLHSVLVEQEPTMFAIAVGGAVQLHSTYAIDLYAFLLRADVHYFFPESDAAAAAVEPDRDSAAQAGAPVRVASAASGGDASTRRTVSLQRCWSNCSAMLKQLVKVQAPGELLLRTVEALTCLTEHPSCCLWLLTTADLGGSAAAFGWNVKQLLGSVAELLQHTGVVMQQRWLSAGAGHSVMGGRADAPVIFSTAAASSVRSALETGTRALTSAGGRKTPHLAPAQAGPAEVAAATSKLLAMHPLLPRLVQTLRLGEDTALLQVAGGLSAVFLSSVHATVTDGFMSDAADWVFLHAVLAQPALGGEHFLRLGDVTVSNVARVQGGLWVRVLTRCNWRSITPLFASVAWWLCALLVEVFPLSVEDRQGLMEKVVTQLPTLTTTTTTNTHGASSVPSAEGRVDEELPSSPRVVPSTTSPLPEVQQRLLLSRHVHEAEQAARAGATEDPPSSQVQALRASTLLYDVVRHLLLSLLKSPAQCRRDTFTSTVLTVAGALPVRRVACDGKLTAALPKVLVPVCEQLPAEDIETLKQYAPQWLADGLTRAGQTIDECLAEQDRRFAQFEWEEKQLAQAATEQQRRDAEDSTTARQNMETLRQQALRDRASAPKAAATTGTHTSTLTALALGVKREREALTEATDSHMGDSTDGWMRAKQHRDALEAQVAQALHATPRPVAPTPTPAATTTTTTAAVVPRTETKRPTVLQQRLQAVNAQHAQHAQHIRNQGDLETLLRRVAASTNLAIKPPYTEDIIGTGPGCLAAEVPVLPSVFEDRTSLATDLATGAAARSIQHWSATGRLYANSFAPHIALELRFDVMRAFDEWQELCRRNDFIQSVSTRRESMMSSRPLSVAERFPLNRQVEEEASAVVLVPNTVSLVDALNPLEATFTVQSIDLGNGGGRNRGVNGGARGQGRFRSGAGQGGAAPLFVDFAEGDIVLALLPLAVLLPHWLSYQRERSAAEGQTYTTVQQEALLEAVPAFWRVMGCLPHVCYVKALVFGQRTATLATYPTAIPQGSAPAAGHHTRIMFQHALQVVFREGCQVPFYLYKMGSLGQAFTSINALHRIHETHFALTLYDPRRSAADSQKFLANIQRLCIAKGALPALRARMLLQSTLNVWQAQAVLAVLYASIPSWDRSAPLDTSVRGYSVASAEALATSPITMVNDATSNFFFMANHPGGRAGGAANAAGPSFATLRDTPLFSGARIPDILLIEGPPGTGKTQTIAVLVLNLLMHLPVGSRVLLCAPSNCAVDEALLRVQRLQHRLSTRHSPLRAFTGTPPPGLSAALNGKLRRVGVRKSVDEAVLRALPPVFLDDLIEQAMGTNNNNNNNGANAHRAENSHNANKLHNRRQALREKTLNEASVVFSTLGSLNHVQRNGMQFDVVIVDEASQGTEPDVLQALMLAKKKVVLVGDSKQLQPTILCKEAARCGLRRSLLVRLLQNEHRSFLLRTQYRMHPDICAFPNRYFYGAKLRTDQSVLARIQSAALPAGARRGAIGSPTSAPRSVGQRLGSLPRFVFVDVADGAMSGGRDHSLRNQREAHAVVLHMRQLRTFLRMTVQEFGQHAGIITYYSAQRDAIRQLLSPDEVHSSLQIATVDSFQGKEKDIIFISCVRALGPAHLQHLEQVVASRAPGGDGGAKLANPYTPRVGATKKEQEAQREEAARAAGTPFYPSALDTDNLDDGDWESNPDSPTRPNAAHSSHHRATLGFLSNWHRINVSLTRARELCIVYGHQRTIEVAAAVAPARGTAASSHLRSSVTSQREAVLEELEAADEDPQLLSEMIAHARRPNVTTARLAEQERSGRLSLGSLPTHGNQSSVARDVAVVDVDADDEDDKESGNGQTNAPPPTHTAPGLTVVDGRRSTSLSHDDAEAGTSLDVSHRCRAACLMYDRRDNVVEVLQSYRS